MPALPPIARVIKFDFRYTWETGSLASNGFHMSYSQAGVATPSGPDINAVTQQVGDLWRDGVMPVLSDECTFTEAIGTPLDNSMTNVGNQAYSTGGGSAGGTILSSSCFLCSFEIVARWRGGHPRMYIPGGSGGDLLDNANWHTDIQANLQAALNTFFASVNGVSSGPVTLLNPGVVSYYSEHALREPPLFFPFFGFTVHQGVYTQRRRLRSTTP